MHYDYVARIDRVDPPSKTISFRNISGTATVLYGASANGLKIKPIIHITSYPEGYEYDISYDLTYDSNVLVPNDGIDAKTDDDGGDLSTSVKITCEYYPGGDTRNTYSDNFTIYYTTSLLPQADAEYDLSVKTAAGWKDAKTVSVKKSSSWSTAKDVFVKKNGKWQSIAVETQAIAITALDKSGNVISGATVTLEPQ